MPEHGGRGLRLVDDAERHIGFGQPHQRLFDVTRGLVLGDHDFEAVDGAGVVLLVQVIAPDLHFLAGELVAGDFDFLFGADGVFAGRILADHLVERAERLLGAGLVAGDVRDFVEIGGADQVLRVSGVRAAGMQRDVALGRGDAIVIGAGLVIGIGRHDQRLARPFRVGVLAVDLLELLRRGRRVVLGVEEIEALVVEPVGGFVGRRVVLAEKIEAAAGAQARRQQHHGQRAHEPASGASGQRHRRVVAGRDFVGMEFLVAKSLGTNSSHAAVSGSPRAVLSLAATPSSRAGVDEKTRCRPSD